LNLPAGLKGDLEIFLVGVLVGVLDFLIVD
jgi:hypothetical protein